MFFFSRDQRHTHALLTWEMGIGEHDKNLMVSSSQPGKWKLGLFPYITWGKCKVYICRDSHCVKYAGIQGKPVDKRREREREKKNRDTRKV